MTLGVGLKSKVGRCICGIDFFFLGNRIGHLVRICARSLLLGCALIYTQCVLHGVLCVETLSPLLCKLVDFGGSVEHGGHVLVGVAAVFAA